MSHRQPSHSSHPRNQHFVSQALMKSWVGEDGKLVAHGLRYGKARASSTAQVGYAVDFLDHDPVAAEQKWQQFETAFPAAITDLASAGPKAESRKAIREMMALHYIRNPWMKLKSAAINASEWDQVRDTIIRKQPVALQHAYERRYGLHTVGNDGLRRAFDALMDSTALHPDAGALIQQRLTSLVDRACALFARYDVQLCAAPEGSEFVLGDRPGVAVRFDPQGQPTLFDGPVAKAHTFVMPLSPTHMAALGPEAAEVVLTDHGVETWNRVQIRAAAERVFYRPGSAVRGLIVAERPPQTHLR